MCGNQATCTQTITVNDTTPPVDHLPGPATVQCFSPVPAPNIGLVTASDNCGGAVTVTFVSDVATNGTSSCNNVITRTYQGDGRLRERGHLHADDHGQRHDAAVDHLPRPRDRAVLLAVPAPNIGSVTATDNCGAP